MIDFLAREAADPQTVREVLVFRSRVQYGMVDSVLTAVVSATQPHEEELENLGQNKNTNERDPKGSRVVDTFHAIARATATLRVNLEIAEQIGVPGTVAMGRRGGVRLDPLI